MWGGTCSNGIGAFHAITDPRGHLSHVIGGMLIPNPQIHETD